MNDTDGPPMGERAVDERLADWVDGRMSERERDRFAGELRVNAQLRADLQRYEHTVGVVRAALRAPTVPVQLADRILGAVAAAASAPAPRTRWRTPAVWASIGCAAALLAAALWIDRWSAPGPDLAVVASEAPRPELDAGSDVVRDGAPGQDAGRARAAGTAADAGAAPASPPAASPPASEPGAGDRSEVAATEARNGAPGDVGTRELGATTSRKAGPENARQRAAAVPLAFVEIVAPVPAPRRAAERADPAAGDEKSTLPVGPATPTPPATPASDDDVVADPELRALLTAFVAAAAEPALPPAAARWRTGRGELVVSPLVGGDVPASTAASDELRSWLVEGARADVEALLASAADLARTREWQLHTGETDVRADTFAPQAAPPPPPVADKRAPDPAAAGAASRGSSAVTSAGEPMRVLLRIRLRPR